MQGQIIPVKQCMEEGMAIEVETVDFDNPAGNVQDSHRAKRFPLKVR